MLSDRPIFILLYADSAAILSLICGLEMELRALAQYCSEEQLAIN